MERNCVESNAAAAAAVTLIKQRCPRVSLQHVKDRRKKERRTEGKKERNYRSIGQMTNTG